MPELPEVETIARQLRSHEVEGREILAVCVDYPRMVEPLEPKEFSKAVCGHRIEKISRTGKWLQFTLGSGQSIMIHLRMSGGFSKWPGKHDRVELQLSGGMKLYFRDVRKFGCWKLADDPQSILGRLGPDALSPGFTARYLDQALAVRRRKIKPLLLDQSVLSGLGNIYADEVLWTACIHPERPSNTLAATERTRLFRAIRRVLRSGIRNRGASLGRGKANYRDINGNSGGHRRQVKAYGRRGLPCERCGVTLVGTLVGQRGTTHCPQCQVKS